MFADLNIPFIYTENAIANKKKGKTPTNSLQIDRDDSELQWSGINSNDRKSLETRTRMLIHLGYRVLAYEHYVKNFSIASNSNPFPQNRPVFPDLDTRTTSATRSIIQLRRLTIELDEGTAVSSQISQAASSVFSGYDILAVKVVGPNSFNNACLNMAAPSPFAINIIQIDLSANTRLPFFFKRNTAGKAISDGAFFEICYGGALDGSNEYGRRNLIAGVKEIVRVTGGKGIIFSSNVKNALHLRSPYDVINLGTVFGINQATAKEALFDNCKALISNAESRRLFKGIFDTPKIHQAPSKRANTEESTNNNSTKNKKAKRQQE
ncbi:PHP domain-like protein [Wallemia mellicola]|nr:PHP domain-like protein [Wallemia mellicola]